MIIESNTNGCVDESKRGERTCMECYWSHVDERNRWMGNERCWDAQCLVVDHDGKEERQ